MCNAIPGAIRKHSGLERSSHKRDWKVTRSFIRCRESNIYSSMYNRFVLQCTVIFAEVLIELSPPSTIQEVPSS